MFDFVANHTSSQQPVVPGLARRRRVPYAGFYVEAGPRLRHVAGGAAANHPALPRLPAAGRPGDRGLDDVRPGPGRRRRARPEDPAGAHRRAARVPRQGASAVRLDAIGFLWKESGTTCLHLPADPRGDQDVARAGRPRGAGHPAADRDQRAARREHLLLRRRARRGPPRLPVRAPAAGAALLRRRLDRPAQHVGRRASVRSATPRPGSTSWPATTASGCGRPRASSTTPSVMRSCERTHSHGGRVSWAARSDGPRSVYELNLSYLDALCTPEEARDPEVVVAKSLAAHSILFTVPRRARGLPALPGRLAPRPRGRW